MPVETGPFHASVDRTVRKRLRELERVSYAGNGSEIFVYLVKL